MIVLGNPSSSKIAAFLCRPEALAGQSTIGYRQLNRAYQGTKNALEPKIPSAKGRFSEANLVLFPIQNARSYRTLRPRTITGSLVLTGPAPLTEFLSNC
jgi:hypothetical protein